METLLLPAYLIVVLAVGVKVFDAVLKWIGTVDYVVPPRWRERRPHLYGVVAIVTVVVLESIVLVAFGGSAVSAAIALTVFVGPIEELSKLLPFWAVRGTQLVRWRVTISAAMTFAVIEAVLYGIVLIITGNILGALLRIIVVTFHVLWTTIALEDALKGRAFVGYLKSSLLHSLYDAPVIMVLVGVSATITVPLTLAGILAVIYMYRRVDGAFGYAYSIGRREIEERRRKTEREECLTSSP
ncbi:PrsW family intramembrane metalloprotease [Thermococcus sp. M36]|uniref:hypothetical protein n=1 Tax=Thermococcus sp. M36 TaxID=1638261 RepID=UPI00143AA664|nr:hypothetical protein [Thermococcus sp. M36]NJE05353.1 PrsW family intramembrane metalloprotease [Thermococcus sp. M36]